MAIRQVTVFGGTGFIGRYIVQRLAQRGLGVRVAVRRPATAEFLRPMGEVGQVVPIQANLRNRPSLERAIAGADAVVNATGIVAQSGRQRFEAVHIDAPRAIGEISAATGVAAVVHLSGIGADEGASEANPTAYVRSKAAGETAIREAFPRCVALRPSIVFGPEDNFFNKLAMIARLAPFMPVFGDGSVRVQPVYVGDVADGAVNALLDARHAGKVFELGGPTVYTYRQIAGLVVAQMARRRRLVSVPFPLLKLAGLVGGLLPAPPLTYEQACLLEHDNVVHAGMPGLADLGVVPTAVEIVLPQYMDRFRLGGRYTTSPAQ